MLTVFSEKHALHDSKTELHGGELVAPFECPVRAEHILQRVREVSLGDIIAPAQFAIERVTRIHDPDFIQFLETCWSEWSAAGFKGEAIASCWPAQGMQPRIPDHVDGKIGYYALAAETAISKSTWEAAGASVDFKRYGATIAGLNLPTLFVMEGGYAIEDIGINAVNVLEGYEAR